MPYLRSSESRRCTEDRPCAKRTPCAKCLAERVLTRDDWTLVEFYGRVASQYINQTPMGGAKGAPPVLTPRLEGYEAALRIYGYPREMWAWLTDWAQSLHGLVHKMDRVNWLREAGAQYGQLDPMEWRDD